MNLTEEQWRIVHNALSVYRSQQYKNLVGFSYRGQEFIDKIQVVMDKVRDDCIAPLDKTKEKFGLLPAAGDFVQ